MRLGLFQESGDRFALAIHTDTEPARVYTEFTPGDLRASVTEQEGGRMALDLTGGNAAVERARDVFAQRLSDRGASVEGAVMALDTAADSWALSVLRSDMPGYHVALAFALIPLTATFGPDRLVQIPYELVTDTQRQRSWRILHPVVVRQAATIVCADAPTEADACAVLANRPGLVDYLVALGDTFSLADIEQLARIGQRTFSLVVASARGFKGEDRSWLYTIQLSSRAIQNQGHLALTYARARARHTSDLRNRLTLHLTEKQRDFQEGQIERVSHHLAVLQLCSEFGIGLWSCPMSAAGDLDLDQLDDAKSGQGLVVVPPESGEADDSSR